MLSQLRLSLKTRRRGCDWRRRALHVHPKTIRYRLGRLTTLTGLRLRHPPDRFRLELAVHLLRLGLFAGSLPVRGAGATAPERGRP
jgi:hypothetical protein